MVGKTCLDRSFERHMEGLVRLINVFMTMPWGVPGLYTFMIHLSGMSSEVCIGKINACIIGTFSFTGEKLMVAPRQVWVLDSIPWISDSRYWIPYLWQWNLDSGFLQHCIPDSKAQDSGFHKQKFPVFRNPDCLTYMGQWCEETFASMSCLHD